MIDFLAQLTILLGKFVCLILFIIAVPFVCIAGAVSGLATGIRKGFKEAKKDSEVVWERFKGYRKK